MNEQILTYRPLPGARLNMAHPYSKGLVGCWLLNENGGIRAMDLSPYGNHGKLVGFDSPPRRPFNGLPFDGTNDYIVVPHSACLDIIGDFTLEAWVNPTDFTNNLYIYCKGLYNAEGVEIRIQGTTGQILYRTSQAVVTQSSISLSALTASVIQQVVITRRGTLAKFFFNSILSRYSYQGSHLDPLTSSRTSEIGAYDAPSTYFKGLMGLVRIWNLIPLGNPADVAKQLYLSPYSPMGTPMFLT